MKKYIINENQYKYLIELKKNKKIYNDIVSEIKQYELYLNESINLNEAVIDVLKKYAKRGLLTTALISSLLSNNIVSANDLISAGIPKEKIEQVEKKENKFSHFEILENLIKILKTRGNKRDKEMYYNLIKLNDDAQKKITKEISSKITDLDDMWKYKYNILTSQDEDKYDKYQNISLIDKEEIIKIDSSFVETKITNLEKNFKNNSAKITNQNNLKKDLENIFNGYHTINQIIIKTSSNTLRNTGDFENMTWEESSLLRANEIKKIILNIKYTLGCDNPIKSIEESIIKIDASGENGDGTSGPKSPFEVEKKYIEQYKKRGIDEIYWKSNATKAPLKNLNDYEKYNYVHIIIRGVVLEENKKIYRNFKYLQMIDINSGDKKIRKIKFPSIFKSGKPKIYKNNKVGAKPCPNPQSAYN